MSSVNILKKDETLISKTSTQEKKDCLDKLITLKTNLQSLGYELNGNVIDLTIRPKNWLVEKMGSNKDEALDLLEKIKICQLKYNNIGKFVNEVNSYDSVKIYMQGEVRFNERFQYYKYLTNKQNYKNPEGVLRNESNSITLTTDFDLGEYVKYRGPVVVAQEFYGCGARCSGKDSDDNPKFDTKEEAEMYMKNKDFVSLKRQKEITYSEIEKFFDEESQQFRYRIPMTFKTTPQYDIYDDRITKIYYDKNSKIIIIQEFYRANVDISVKFYQNLIDPQSKSTQFGVYDFIVGYFSITKETSLFLFNYNLFEEIIKNNETDEKTITKINETISRFKKNVEDNYQTYTRGVLDGVRKAKAVDNGDKIHILIHRGGNAYNSSMGCLTINDGDYNTFKNHFEMNKFGLVFLYRDEF